MLRVHDVAQVTKRDRDIGRRLPDKFMKMPGTPIDRLTELVNRYWMSHTAPARSELSHALLLVLQPLLEPGAEVSDQKRQTCEDIVASWLSKQ